MYWIGSKRTNSRTLPCSCLPVTCIFWLLMSFIGLLRVMGTNLHVLIGFNCGAGPQPNCRRPTLLSGNGDRSACRHYQEHSICFSSMCIYIRRWCALVHSMKLTCSSCHHLCTAVATELPPAETSLLVISVVYKYPSKSFYYSYYPCNTTRYIPWGGTTRVLLSSSLFVALWALTLRGGRQPPRFAIKSSNFHFILHPLLSIPVQRTFH